VTDQTAGDVYPPMAQQLFQENPQVWRAANQVTDLRTIALWYGAAASPELYAGAVDASITGYATLEGAGVPVTAGTAYNQQLANRSEHL